MLLTRQKSRRYWKGMLNLDAFKTPCLDGQLLRLVEQFAETNGKTTDECIREAVLDWLTTTAYAKMESLTKPQLAKTA